MVSLTCIYVFIVMIAMLLYALIELLCLNGGLAANLLIWSASIFAPIALLVTYNGWKDQKVSEILASESKIFYSYLHDNYQNINWLVKIIKDKKIATTIITKYEIDIMKAFVF